MTSLKRVCRHDSARACAPGSPGVLALHRLAQAARSWDGGRCLRLVRSPEFWGVGVATMPSDGRPSRSSAPTAEASAQAVPWPRSVGVRVSGPAHGHRPGEPARDGALGPGRVTWLTSGRSGAARSAPARRPPDVDHWSKFADFLATRSSAPWSSPAWSSAHSGGSSCGSWSGRVCRRRLRDQRAGRQAARPARGSGQLSFPSGNVTAVCATALAMWIALYPVLGMRPASSPSPSAPPGPF